MSSARAFEKKTNYDTELLTASPGYDLKDRRYFSLLPFYLPSQGFLLLLVLSYQSLTQHIALSPLSCQDLPFQQCSKAGSPSQLPHFLELFLTKVLIELLKAPCFLLYAPSLELRHLTPFHSATSPNELL